MKTNDGKPRTKKFFASLWKILKNKYVCITLICLVFYFFLSENNIMVINKLKHELSDLDREADLLEATIKQDSADAVALINNPDALETYGREHYYMKRDNEDIFIIKDEEPDGKAKNK